MPRRKLKKNGYMGGPTWALRGVLGDRLTATPTCSCQKQERESDQGFDANVFCYLRKQKQSVLQIGFSSSIFGFYYREMLKI
jgi:hypothetical protein